MNGITLSRRGAWVHADFVRRACLRYVQNRDEADDLAQEVLLKVARAGSGFSGDSRPATWLYRVTINHCLDHLRREKRLRAKAEVYAAAWQSEQAEQGRSGAPPEGNEGNAGGWERPTRKTRVAGRVLERLRATSGETDRHVIYLRFDLDLSQSGIAEILGVSRAAVGQRLARIHSRAAYIWREVFPEVD